MRSSVQIEAQVREILDRVKRGEPIEDSTVECKATWPEPKVARQLAGHANAARGAPILWLIGVDLGKQEIPGVLPRDLASWYPQVAANFDGFAPRMTDVNVAYDGKTVVALSFETDRGAPFIVRIEGDDARRDVPWREGTRTRSADRHELFQILSPAVRIPRCEILSAELHAFQGTPPVAMMRIHIWITPRSSELLSLRLHQCRIVLTNQLGGRISPPDVIAEPEAAPHSSTIEHARHHIICRGPGRVMLSTEFHPAAFEADPERPLEIEASLVLDDLEAPIELKVVLKPWPRPRGQQSMVGYWKVDPLNVVHLGPGLSPRPVPGP